MGAMRVMCSSLKPVLVAAFALVVLALPATAEPRHGLSTFGDLKYGADFKNFDYANPDAPKAGRLAMMGSGGATTFDSFNNFIVKGDAAHGLDFLFDSLMIRAADEPDAVYGLVAATADVASDGMSVTFKLREAAKFSDGTPVTADDVIFSFTTLKEKGNPAFGLALRDVASAEAPDKNTVRYAFKGTLVRDLPTLVAGLPVLSKAYYSAHPFEETSLDKPLGSGPYLISQFAPGTYITYKRRDDYWAKDLPVNRGRYNFSELRYEYYRDRNVELENLKSGTFDYREEFTSVNWATGYDIPAVKDGRLIKDTLADENPSGAQGFFINTRRDKFKDPRVREALGQVFDFEWSNKKLFYGLYTRTASFFENSDMKAKGPPSPEELALLDPFKDKLPPAVFGEPYSPPVTDGNGDNRDGLKKARDLLSAAGWKIGNETVDDPECGLFCKIMTAIGLKSKPSITMLRNAKGESLDLEILGFEEAFDRVILPYVGNLKRIGVNASSRRVDPAQYQRRIKSFDFDLTPERYSLRLNPGVELRSYWGADSAKMDGSQNLAGIADPVIDALIEKVTAAKSRLELVTATRAIDRVLRAGHFWVPHWYKAAHNVAYWNKFARPATKPKYDTGVVDTWWLDSAKAAALKTK